MRQKRFLALFLTLAMALSLVCLPASAADEEAKASFPDAEGSWAASSIDRWAKYGIVNGDSNGNVNPDADLTRGELAKMFVNLFGLTEKAPNTYADLKGDEWYADAILKCTAAGIMKGDGKSCNATDDISRAETVVMFGRAMGVAPAETPKMDFTDASAVPDWAAGYLAPLAEMGILSGGGDGSIAPLNSIDRASTLALLDKAITEYVNAPGEVTVENANGFVVVNAAGGEVVLTGAAAGVVVAAGSSEGKVVAKDLTAGTVKVDGTAAVAIQGKSAVGTVAVNAAASVEIAKEAKADAVAVTGEKAELTVAGSVGTVAVAETAANTTVKTQEGAKIDSVENAAEGVAVTGKGTVAAVTTTTDVKVSTPNTVTSKTETKVDEAGNTVTTETKTTNNASGKPSKVETTTTTTKPDGTTGTTTETTKPNTGGGGYVPGPSYTVVTTVDELKSAISDGGYIRLGADIADLTETLTVADGKSVTLDLYGKTLTLTSGQTLKSGSTGVNSISAFLVEAGGTFILEDSGSGGKITIAETSGTPIDEFHYGYNVSALIEVQGAFTVNSGTILTTVNNYWALAVKGAACNVTLNGGTIDGSWTDGSNGGGAIAANGNVQNGGYSITIHPGARLLGGETAVYLPSAGTVVMNGGTVDSKLTQGIAIRAGSLTIHGGTIASHGARVSNATSVNGEAGNYTGALTVVRSKYTSGSGYNGDIHIKIDGGTLSNSDANGDALVVFHETGSVTDGTVQVEISGNAKIEGGKYIQDGFGSVEGDSLTLDGAAYVFSAASLASAIKQEASQVKLGSDITGVAETIPVTSSLALDLNSYTITSDGVIAMVFSQSAGTFAISNGTIDAVGAYVKPGSNADAGTGAYGALIVNGGTLEISDVTLKNHGPWGLNIKLLGGNATLTNVDIFSAYGGGIEVSGADTHVALIDCNFTQTNYNDCYSTAVSVSNGGTADVFGGTYTAAGYAMYVLSSGGTINIQGGTFSGETGVMNANADLSSYPSAVSTININDGTFNGPVKADDKQAVRIHINGGIFSKAELTLEQFRPYVTAGHSVSENDGVFMVSEAASE